MKVMAFSEARTAFKDAVDAAQSDRVVITVHGKPAAVLIGVRGKTFDDLYLASPEFWSVIEARQRSPRPMASLEEVANRLDKKDGKKAVPRSRRAKAKKTG
jgi:prevent-host-death family protein